VFRDAATHKNPLGGKIGGSGLHLVTLEGHDPK
jgi:hypothetical protein